VTARNHTWLTSNSSGRCNRIQYHSIILEVPTSITVKHVLVSTSRLCQSWSRHDALQRHCMQVRLSAIALLLDFKLDESYTPSKIAIRAGTTYADLKEVGVPAALRTMLYCHCALVTSSRDGTHVASSCTGAPADADEPTGLVQHPAFSARPAVSVPCYDSCSLVHAFHIADFADSSSTVVLCRDGTPLKAFLVQVAVLLNHQNGRDSHLRQIRIFGPRELPTLCTDGLENLSPEFAMYSCVR
jgi:Anaphase-promoting complex, subunit 10 (APC10)